ncbi:imidazolonepropionase [Bacteriovorax sp. DB6_IX]|uniref:imidazolonepropionase n=1 Tax=Bacteriovorax sp. DB6_IX TaxID=1353530 RepID=UPI000389F2F8|nr:imidazolonepropionase [Bacteriovorax sp. DB6_IX]EQC51295.1 imidazolonepropionase [Bacteriovorax sp. DB6_IX]
MITLLNNISEVLTLESAFKKDGRNLLPEDSCIIDNAAVIHNQEEILWVGSKENIPSNYKIDQEIDLMGKVLTPELVDSHTHAIFGGNRADEYTMRLNGADYQAIAKAGGGILSTSKGTNSLSEDELFNSTVEKIERIASYGVGTIEIKSGYALNYEGEKLCSKVIGRIKEHFAPRIQIFNTYLAAHAVPKSFKDSAEYLNQVVIPLMKDLADEHIIDAVDIFHEEGYFSYEDTKLLFEEALKLGFKLKIHADEFGDNKGAKLAAEFNALSADHLLCTTQDGIEALAKSSTVATVLPGTGWFLGKPQANAKKMIDAGCKLAIASDYNPGSCHCDNLLLIASMAAPMYPLNMTQMWSAITMNSAAALGFNNQGAIIPGLKPRFAVFKTNKISEITYNWGRNLAEPI